MNLLWSEMCTSAQEQKQNILWRCWQAGESVWLSTVKQGLSQEELLLQKEHKKDIRVCSCTQGQRTYFWRLVLWSEETKIELFGHIDNHFIWTIKGEACKPEITISNDKYEHHVIGLFCCRRDWYTLQNRCWNTEATSQDISQEIKAWLQTGFLNKQWTSRIPTWWWSDFRITNNVLEWPSQRSDLNPMGRAEKACVNKVAYKLGSGTTILSGGSEPKFLPTIVRSLLKHIQNVWPKSHSFKAMLPNTTEMYST